VGGRGSSHASVNPAKHMSKTNVFKTALAYARDSFLCERSDDRLAVRRGLAVRPQRPRSASRSIPTSTAGASDPPRSRSAAQRRCGSAGSPRTRRSGRRGRSRGASGREVTRHAAPDRARQGALVAGARADRVSCLGGYAVEPSPAGWRAYPIHSRSSPQTASMTLGEDYTTAVAHLTEDRLRC
jgi:hypothetical protein